MSAQRLTNNSPGEAAGLDQIAFKSKWKGSSAALLPEEMGPVSDLLEQGARNVGNLILLTKEQLLLVPPEKILFDFAGASYLHRKDVDCRDINEKVAFGYGFELHSKQAVRKWQEVKNLGSHRLIAVTGCTGSGKSSVVEVLEEQGAIILDADKYAAQVVKPGEEGLRRLVAEFGTGLLQPDGRLNRPKLAKMIFFGDQEKKKRVEELLHPLVRERYCKDLLRKTEDLPSEGKLIVWDVPLFFESNLLHAEVESLIVIIAPRNVCLDRIIDRDSIDSDDAAHRFDSQVPPEEKEKAADIVIHNTKDIDSLAAEVRKLYEKLRP